MHQTETATNTALNDCKKDKRKIQDEVSSVTTGRKTKEQEHFKKKLDRTGIDKEGSLEWLSRGQINWDGEGVIINAQDQGHYMSVFNKMAGLSQSAKCRFCGVETESTSHLLLGCKKLMSEQLYTERHDTVC